MKLPRLASVACWLLAVCLASLAARAAEPQAKPSDQLRKLLLAAVPDNPRTRRCQAALDDAVSGALERFRRRPGYYAPGRDSTYALGAMAFCYHSPLSKHHGNEEILKTFSDAAEKWADGISPGGRPGAASYPNSTWSHGWDIEGLIYGYFWLEDKLDPKLKEKLKAAFERAARRFVNRTSGEDGAVGNQQLVGCLGDLLYGLILDNPEYVQRAKARYDDVVPKVLESNGQVIEQHGPCMHYSYTAYVYAFQFAYIAQDRRYDASLLQSLDWFHLWHTESLYHFPGASARGYYNVRGVWHDLYGAVEYFAPQQPMFQKMMDRMMEKDRGWTGHTCNTLIWAILNCKQGDLQPTDEHKRQWTRDVENYYYNIFYGRSPIKYCIVRHRYQTSITFDGYLPLKGLQTWAWAEEPPVIHPTLSVRSGTTAVGLDSAEFSISHERPDQGAGVMVEQIVWRGQEVRDAHGPGFVVWRQGNLRSVAIFTPVSTVLILSGPTGRRVTRWALNPWEPAEPKIEQGVVSFAGRTARLYAVGPVPTLAEQKDTFTDKAVRLLEYASEGQPTAFAFSNETFRFLADHLAEEGTLEFRDGSGAYRADISTIVDRHGYLTWQAETAKVVRTGD
jgi:hypothetical protein